MEEAVAVREAALDAVDDVVPDPLRAAIEQFVADGSLVPGVLTLLAARAAAAVDATGTSLADGVADVDGDTGAVDAGDAGDADGETGTVGARGVDGIAVRAAGVQLIYDGLRLTRRLVHEEPWTDAADSGGIPVGAEAIDADVDILAADVLVARGFYLLARTEAATVAVDVVRAFGRDQTARRDAADPGALDHELERDVLRLAVVAGAAAAGGEPEDPEALAGDLAAEYDDGFPAPETLFDEGVRERVASVAGPRR